MKCIGCLRDRELLPKKKFCNECNLNGRECIRCHRPMPPKFYLLHSHRCNSCHKKHEKEKLKRLFVDIYVLYLYNVNCFLLEWQLGEFETITVKNGKFGKFVELNQRPRLAHQKPRFFTFTPNTWKKFYVKALDLNTVEDRIQLAEKKMVMGETQKMSPDIHFGNPDHADKQVSEQRRSPELTFGSRMSRTNFEDVERRMAEQQALVTDIKCKRQTDDDKTG